MDTSLASPLNDVRVAVTEPGDTPSVPVQLNAQDPRLKPVLANVGDLSFRRRIRTILDFLLVRDDDVVLDAGCGEGFYLMLLSELTRAQKVLF